jgi:hypothetical protein
MKLLFDENLSPKLPRLIESQFPGSVHVRRIRFRIYPPALLSFFRPSPAGFEHQMKMVVHQARFTG